MPVLECHHGHGRARRPLCRSSLWPLVSSLWSPPALAALLLAHLFCLSGHGLVFETLSSGAVVWIAAGSTDTMPVSGGGTLSCFYFQEGGRDSRRPVVAATQTQTDRHSRPHWALQRRLYSPSLSLESSLLPRPQKYNSDDARNT